MDSPPPRRSPRDAPGCLGIDILVKICVSANGFSFRLDGDPRPSTAEESPSGPNLGCCLRDVKLGLRDPVEPGTVTIVLPEKSRGKLAAGRGKSLMDECTDAVTLTGLTGADCSCDSCQSGSFGSSLSTVDSRVEGVDTKMDEVGIELKLNAVSLVRRVLIEGLPARPRFFS